MRLLIFSPALGATLGGGERYLLALLQQLELAGHQLTVVTSQAQQEQDFWQGTAAEAPPALQLKAELIQLPIPPFPGGQRQLFRRRRLMALAGQLPPFLTPWLPAQARNFPQLKGLEERLARLVPAFDLVHGFNLSWEGPLLAAGAYAAAHALPLVITPFANTGTLFGRLLQQMSHQRRLLRQAARIQVLSPVEAAGLQQWGVPQAKIDTVGMGLDATPASPNLAVAEQSLPEQFALFIGRASRDKGVHTAIEAITSLPAERAIPLLLAGRVDAAIQAQIAALPDRKRDLIRPLGRVTEAAKRQLLRQTTMLLLPSRSDAFGIVILEAWQWERPVIAARAGGIPGVIDDGQNGLLVPYGQPAALRAAMDRLLTEPQLRRNLGRAGAQKLARDYSWPAAMRRLAGSYDLALKTNP